MTQTYSHNQTKDKIQSVTFPFFFKSLKRLKPAYPRRSLLLLALILPLSTNSLSASNKNFEIILPSSINSTESGNLRTAVEDALEELLRDKELVDEAEDQRLRRKVKQALTELLHTRGYFLGEVEIHGLADKTDGLQQEQERSIAWQVNLTPGQQAKVGKVEIAFKGEINHSESNPERVDRVEQLYSQWELWTGQNFTQQDWELAKRNLLQRVASKEFPRAMLAESQAEVDTSNQQVDLSILIDSGPAFQLGAIDVTGLSKYNKDLVSRYNKLESGQPYDQEKLLETQSLLQNTPYFSGVQVDYDTDVPENIDSPVIRPLKLKLTEAKSKRLGVGIGYSSNSGPHIEMSYRQSPFWSDANVLQAGMRIDQLRTLLYADILLPPNTNGYRDSLGVLHEHTDIQGLKTQRSAIGVTRAKLRGTIETRLALNVQRESREVNGIPTESAGVFTGTYTWTQRAVDNITDPRTGYTWVAQVGAGNAFNFNDRPFSRAYLRGQYYYPFNAEDKRNVLSVRAEVGSVNAPNRAIVPSDFLFRAGGTQSVRGYAFQSLGINTNGAILGGEKLATLSTEWVHWFDAKQGSALFYDLGAVDDSFRDMKIAHGIGVGYRYKTVAGPLAFDLAYGTQRRALKFHFSIAIAF